MCVGLGVACLEMLLPGQFAFPLFIPPDLEFVDESDELVDEDLPFRLVELLLVLVDACETHHTQPVLTA
jgi:hypothetical protein